MATVSEGLRRYIEPFYPASAEEQSRLQEWFLGDATDEIDDVPVTDVTDPGLVEDTRKKLDLMQEQLKKTTCTVKEMDRHLVRCRHDVDDLVATFGENVTQECNHKVDKKVSEFHDKMETFDGTLQKKCEQAGHTAVAYMKELVDEQNAKVQQVNEHLEGRITSVQRLIDEKASRNEVATLASEHCASKIRLEKFQKKHDVLYEKRGKDMAQVMRNQKMVYGWVKSIRKEQDTTRLGSQEEAKARRALDYRLRALEQQPRVKQVSSQALISVSRDPCSPRGLETGSYLQHTAKIEELTKMLESYKSRLNKLEKAAAPLPTSTSARTGPCEGCEESLRTFDRTLKKLNETSAEKNLELLEKFEIYRRTSDARYVALEGKFDRLAGLIKEPPAPAVDWQAVARLEILEEDKRWNDRVRQLETFGAVTPESVIKHMEQLETRLGIALYERGSPLPNTIARGRIAWAWNVLENAAREDNTEVTENASMAYDPQDVLTQTFLQPAIYQQQTLHPQEAQLELPPRQISEHTVYVEAISQPSRSEVDPQTIACEEISLQETTKMDHIRHEGSPKPRSPQLAVQQSLTTETNKECMDETILNPPAFQAFTSNNPNIVAPSVEVPLIDWSAPISVDLSRKASEFGDDDHSEVSPIRPVKASGIELSPIAAGRDVVNMDLTTATSSGASDVGHATISYSDATGCEGASPKIDAFEASQEPLFDEQETFSLGAPPTASLQSPFSVLPTKKSSDDPTSVSSLEQQGHPASYPLYGTDASSAYTTVLGAKSVTQATATSSDTGLSMTERLTQQPSSSYPSNTLTRYTPIQPLPTESTSWTNARHRATATPTQQAPGSLTTNSPSSYTPAQSSPTDPGTGSIQRISHTGTGPTATSLTLPVKSQAYGTGPYERSMAEKDGSQLSTALEAGKDVRIIKPKPKGRWATMTDEQKNAVRLEMQIPASDTGQGLPPSIHLPPVLPMPADTPALEIGTSSTKCPSTSAAFNDREDEVDYGDTDDESPAPSNTPAVIEPVPGLAGLVMHRYSTQWLKIWRSHVASENNLRAFAESSGFGDAADRWVAIVENANADTSSQDMLRQANIGLDRQLYSADDVEEIAKAFFEVCLVQSDAFKSAIEKFDPFDVDNYHENFLVAFKNYLKQHPADSF